MSLLWFEHCQVYLNRLESLDAYFTLYDTMPTATHDEKREKRLTFDGLMRTLKHVKDVEQDLDELWGLN
jgi:hypothetical protein